MESNQKQNLPADTSESKWKGFYSTSGVLLIIIAVLWTAVSRAAARLYAAGYPVDPAAYLQLVSQHQGLAALTWSLWIVSDFLLMAPTIAIYLVLRRFNRTLALIGCLFAMFFNIYDVCVTEMNSLVLVYLGHGYAAAASEALRSAFSAAAAYGYYSLPLQTVLSFATGTLGYLLWCVVMFKSIFRRGVAIFGAVVMVEALIGSAAPLFPNSIALSLCQTICVPACALWFVLVGIQLLKYAKGLGPGSEGATTM